MAGIVMDTSALISLEVIGVMEKLFDIAQVIVPQAVEEEIRKLKRFKNEEGRAAERISRLIKTRGWECGALETLCKKYLG